MLKYNCRLHVSTVHGQGVFATRAIKAGDICSKYDGRLTTTIVDRHHYISEGPELFYTGNTGKLASPHPNNIGQFVNDSTSLTKGDINTKQLHQACFEYEEQSKTNCNAVFTKIGQNWFVQAITSILPGQELFVSYGAKFWVDSLDDYVFSKKMEKLVDIVETTYFHDIKFLLPLKINDHKQMHKLTVAGWRQTCKCINAVNMLDQDSKTQLYNVV
jgi:SET domain-containing protein